MSVVTFAQNNGITYQAVIYSASGESIPGIQNPNSPLVNKAICLQFSVIDESSQTEYQEKVTITTDDFGMVNLIIGNGTQTGGYASSFNSIVWSNSKKYLKVSLDQSGACSTFEEISNQLLTYVPFALAADSAASVSGIVGIAHGGTNATTVIGAKTNLQLQNVDNTSDLNKPISTATQTALNLKAPINNPIFTGTVSGVTQGMVGLGNVDNTSDVNKPISIATQTALNLKAPINNPIFTGTVSGITKAMVGLGNIDNTSDLNKPISTATQTTLNSKVDKVVGKNLSTEDFTTAEKTKLAAISGLNTGDQDLSSYATLTNLSTKVDKVVGKDLSTNDFTTAEKTKLAAISGVNTGDQDLSSYATLTNLSTKVDKVVGKDLSTNDFTTAEKTKLAAISGVNTGDQDLSSYATLTNLSTKVDKVVGKDLSTNDFTTVEKTKLASISGVNTGDQDLSSYATLTNLSTKVDKVVGKDLSTNDYTTVEKNKLAAATDTNTVSTIVARDGNGNFSAGTISATLNGNALSATQSSNLSGGSVGQVLYQTAAGTTGFISGNVSSTKKFLSATGSNGAATAPTWQSLTPSDIVASSSTTAGYLNFETGVFSAQNWTELNSQWTITSGWANTRNYNGLAYQGSYAIMAPESQDFTLQSSQDFNLRSVYLKSDFQITATSIEFKGYNASGTLIGTVTVNVSSLNQFSFSNVAVALNGIRKLVFHPIGYNPSNMGGGTFALDYFDIDVLTSNNLNTVNGLLKSNGSGSITAAVVGTDYLSPTALTSLVPYTGATGSVNLGSYDLTVNSVKVGLGAGAKPSNTSVGANALISNTTGVYNTAFGKDALQNNAVGGLNTAIGNAALQANTGSFNTGLGKEALSSNTSGSFNTAIGTEALRGNTTGNKITTLGYQAEVASGNLTNATAIGSGAVVSTSNTIQLGDTGVTNVNTYGSITANAAISNEITADFTIDVTNVEQYKGKVIICNPSNPITITFATGLPIGFNCMILQKSADANKINLTGGSGVTMKNRNNYTATAGNYAIATIVSIGGDIMVTAGDMQ